MSGLPKKNKELHILEKIKILEDEGVRLDYETKQLLSNKDPETKLFGFYELWKIQLLHLAEKCENRDFELSIKRPDGVTSNLFVATAFKKDMVSSDPTRMDLANEDLSIVIMGEETIRQVTAMEIGINSKLEALSFLRKSLNFETQKEIHIAYNISIGKFIFNNKNFILLEGKQKDVADCLVKQGENIKVSWDEIYDTFKDLLTQKDDSDGLGIDICKRSVRTAVKEINRHTIKYLLPNRQLIDAKNNEYWLQYQVDKGR